MVSNVLPGARMFRPSPLFLSAHNGVAILGRHLFDRVRSLQRADEQHRGKDGGPALLALHRLELSIVWAIVEVCSRVIATF